MVEKRLARSWVDKITNDPKRLIRALIIFIFAIIIDIKAGKYVDRVADVQVSDILLDSLPVIDIGNLFVWGILGVIAIYFAYALFYKPKKASYFIEMFSLFIIVRAFFISLTHLRVPSEAISLSPPVIANTLFFSNDLFFSGHTGIPFLAFLIIEEKPLKYFMLACSIILGFISLLVHRHYSIDVFAAFFITYGVYKIGEFLFNKDKKSD